MVDPIIQRVYRFGYRLSGRREIFSAHFPRISRAFYSFYRRNVAKDTPFFDVAGFHMCISDESMYEYTLKEYEPYVVRHFTSAIKPSDIVIDIGANIGYYTLVAARCVGEGGRVYAFEPDPANFNMLTENINANSFTNVVPIQKAVCATTGTTQLLQKKPSTHSLFDHPLAPTKRSVPVETGALADFLSTLSQADQQRISLVKIDAEGAEPLILEGLANFIKRKSTLTIICELIPGFYTPDHPSRHVHAPAELVSFLQMLGFSVNVIRGGTLLPWQDAMLDRFDKYSVIDLLCVKHPV
ncbi:MAG: FkbM family methyltransferase [Euryarchaeota archaeon]|nr:FkbM family methyltransferase [Euryarchaeota archaeon]